MAETIFLYILILLTCIWTTQNTPKCIYGKTSYKLGLKYYFYVSIPIIIYTLFWGLRYNVGADYLGYKTIFYNLPNEIENGYKVLTTILNGLGFSYVSIFIITSFFPIIALFIISRKTNKTFAIFIIYFFFTTSFVFFTQNGIRQTIAILIIFILISKIADVKLLYLIILGFLAIQFHKSAIFPLTIIAIIYLLPRVRINKYLLISILILSTFIGNKIYATFLSNFSFLFDTLDYTKYSNRIDNFEHEIELGSGLGMLLKLGLSIVTIYHQDLFIKEKKSPEYYFYLLFLIGIILEPIIASNSLMKRMNFYFITSRFIVFSYLCTYWCLYCKNNGFTKILTWIFCISLFMLYISAILTNSNFCVPYHLISIDNL